MSGVRASIFEDDDLPAAPEPPRPAPEQVRALSEAANFRSREPQPAPAGQGRRKPRTYRTGRTAAFSAKTTPETVDALYAIAERQGWKVGETLERALTALQRELAGPR
jgi:hypothetical protein